MDTNHNASEKIDAPLKKNWVKRTLTGISLIASWSLIIYMGLPFILLVILAIQIKCFDEIINIAYKNKKLPDVPYFRTLNWYFLTVANYLFLGETFCQHLEVYLQKYYVIHVILKYHRFLTFCLYFIGLICFLNLLRRKVIRQQFSLLAWTHFLLIIIVLQSYMLVRITFEGIIWLIIPTSLVILNDICAYVCGKRYGKIPLIKLSPKKTVEGFIGGAILTFLIGILLSLVLCRFQYFVCPVRFVLTHNGEIKMTSECTPSYTFQWKEYNFGNIISFETYPFIWDSIAFSLFASLIAPFGGFCASGFKRAFKVKDFGDLVPGHGGIMDRFDCQYLMGSFVNVYISSFIRTPEVEAIFEKILMLNTTSQVEFYHTLATTLHSQGLLDLNVIKN